MFIAVQVTTQKMGICEEICSYNSLRLSSFDIYKILKDTNLRPL